MKLLKKGYLKVSNIHKIYFELRGKCGGIPAVSIHGGPGSGFKQRHFKNFPLNHCVLFFDQRGCGHSRPLGELRENTTQELVEDIKKLMDHVGFKSAKISGYSWGSTLALCFAIKYPQRVRKLSIGGVYLGTKEESVNLIRNFELFSPKIFQESKIMPTFSGKKSRYMVKLLQMLEGSIMDNEKTWESVKSKRIKKTAWIEPHYLSNDCFLPPKYILRNIGRIKHIPLVIIQGQQDLVCPPVNAWNLSKRFLKKKFIIVPGGHSIRDMSSIIKKNI
jgi:proline iminopeptidase